MFCYSCANISPPDTCYKTEECKFGVKSCIKLNGESAMWLLKSAITFFIIFLIHILATKNDGSQQLTYRCSSKSGELIETCKPLDKSLLSDGYETATICACTGPNCNGNMDQKAAKCSCNGGENLIAAHTWTALSIVLACSTVFTVLTHS